MRLLKYLLIVCLAMPGMIHAQNVKVTDMPTYIGNPNGGWVPVVISGVNRKMDAGSLGYNRVDSMYIGGNNLFYVKRGLVYSLALPGGSGSGDVFYGANGRFTGNRVASGFNGTSSSTLSFDSLASISFRSKVISDWDNNVRMFMSPSTFYIRRNVTTVFNFGLTYLQLNPYYNPSMNTIRLDSNEIRLTGKQYTLFGGVGSGSAEDSVLTMSAGGIIRKRNASAIGGAAGLYVPLAGTTAMAGHITYTTTNTHDIGSPTKAARSGYFATDVNVGANVNALTVTAGGLIYGASLGIAGSPVASSLVDFNSTSKGMLIPRMTTTQRNAIASPASSLLIFNTTMNQFQSYILGSWIEIGSTASSNVFINNQTSLQASSNFNISGTGKASRFDISQVTSTVPVFMRFSSTRADLDQYSENLPDVGSKITYDFSPVLTDAVQTRTVWRSIPPYYNSGAEIVHSFKLIDDPMPSVADDRIFMSYNGIGIGARPTIGSNLAVVGNAQINGDLKAIWMLPYNASGKVGIQGNRWPEMWATRMATNELIGDIGTGGNLKIYAGGIVTPGYGKILFGTGEQSALDDNNGGNWGFGTSSPNALSKVEIASTTQALTIPRQTTTQRNAYSPLNGSIIYDATLNAFFGRISGAWVELASGGSSYNDANARAAISLTTTGTSGAATYNSTTGVFNIPQYSGGGGGSITLGAIGSSPNANGATLTGSVLNLEPASASFGGVVSSGTQTFAGNKSFTGYIETDRVRFNSTFDQMYFNSGANLLNIAPYHSLQVIRATGSTSTLLDVFDNAATTGGKLLDIRNSGGSKLIIEGLSGSVGINTSSVHASAGLQVNSTTKGFLMPRMNSTQRDAISSPADGLFIYNTTIEAVEVFRTSTGGFSSPQLVSYGYALSDETTTITTGQKISFRMPHAMRLTDVRASLDVASTSGTVDVRIYEDAVNIFTSPLTIDETEETSFTTATPFSFDDANLANDAKITMNINAAGTGAKSLKVWITGYRL